MCSSMPSRKTSSGSCCLEHPQPALTDEAVARVVAGALAVVPVGDDGHRQAEPREDVEAGEPVGVGAHLVDVVDRSERVPPDMSSAVRPMALAPDARRVYFQVSFFHGFVEYDLLADKVLRLARPAAPERGGQEASRGLPARLRPPRAGHEPAGDEAVRGGDDVRLRRDRPGTASPYSSLPPAQKPYWSTNSRRRPLLLHLLQRRRPRAAVSYASEREVGSVQVGDHPQRMRMGEVGEGALGVRRAPARGRPGGPRPKLRVRSGRSACAPGRPVRLRVRVTVTRGGRRVAVRRARVRVGGVSARTGRRGRAVLRERRGLERARRYACGRAARATAPATRVSG